MSETPKTLPDLNMLTSLKGQVIAFRTKGPEREGQQWSAWKFAKVGDRTVYPKQFGDDGAPNQVGRDQIGVQLRMEVTHGSHGMGSITAGQLRRGEVEVEIADAKDAEGKQFSYENLGPGAETAIIQRGTAATIKGVGAGI